jgi:hypothetical protein
MASRPNTFIPLYHRHHRHYYCYYYNYYNNNYYYYKTGTARAEKGRESGVLFFGGCWPLGWQQGHEGRKGFLDVVSSRRRAFSCFSNFCSVFLISQVFMGSALAVYTHDPLKRFPSTNKPAPAMARTTSE